MSFFSKKKNKSFQLLRDTAATFAILDEFSRRGILHFHKSLPSKENQGGSALLIEESLATLKLAEGERGFRHFLDQVCSWQNYKLLQDAYEKHRIDVETKAVRDAQRSVAELGNGSTLTKADIQRIRQNARDNMTELDLATVSNDSSLVKEFDLFILRASAPSSALASEANGQLLALGHYDGKNLEMALYDDIKHNLHKNHPE